MLRDKLIDTAVKFGLNDQLQQIRNSLPGQKRNRITENNLRLLLRFTLAANANCIDVGAYRGKILGELVQMAPLGKHIAYEPQPERYQDLVQRFPDVDLRLAALSNVEGESSFTVVKNMQGFSGFREISYPRRAQIEKLTVRTEILDKSLPPGYVPTLIKMDVEGAEGLVIEGALETLARHKPIVVFEHGKAATDYYQTKSSHIYTMLCKDAGLRIFDFDGNGPYSLDQFVESCIRDERWDYIART